MGALWNSEIQMGKIKQLALDILESQEIDFEDGVVYNFPDHPAIPKSVATFCNGKPEEDLNTEQDP